ncbi:MAG: hypothetical protein D3924_16100 [Candidatus Electrothrix sp. AR4]|nr:hypothetical protein [Candidatus Electrothrix sp. AR4]
MFKKTFIGCMVLGLLLSSAFFVQSTELPKPDAETVWNYISKVNPFTDWDFWPDHQGTHDSKAPHAPKHKIYVNKPALESTTPPLQHGSMVIKYNLSPADELKAVTVMYKVKDYNPTAGDWFWAKYTPDGKILQEGKLKKCIACHSSRADNDYILVHEFK